MKDHKISKLVGSICFALGLVLLLFSGFNAEAQLKPTGELKIGVPTLFTETFHPFMATAARKFYYEALFDYLIGVDEDMKIVEGMAKKWEEAPDHMSWTFWIRDGVKFHDGTPVTLEDIKFSLETIVDQKNAVARSLHSSYQDRVEIVPPNKVVLHLKKPWPTLLYFYSPCGQGGGTILPKRYIEEKGVPYFEQHPMGSGPYKFLEKKEGDYIKFGAAGDYHWRIGTPKYRDLIFKMIPEIGTREAALRAGEVDLIQVDIPRASKLESEGFAVHEKQHAVDLNLDFLRLHQPDNPLHKKEVRQALIYAINKAEILKHVLMGRGKLIGHNYLMFSWSISYKDYPVTPYDPKKAKQLLVEAGYPNGFIIYLYSFANAIPEQKLINETIAGYWEAIGMKVKIIELDFGAFLPIWFNRKEPLGPAADVYGWSCRPLDPWRPMYHSNIEKAFVSQIKDAVMDQLIEKYEAAVTLEEFIKADRACEERTLEMFYKSGIACTSIFFASKANKVPKWSLGKGIDNYRFEYIGAKQ